MITMQIQSGVDRDTLETIKKLFFKNRSLRADHSKRREKLRNDSIGVQIRQKLRRDKNGIDADLKSYANGDLSGFEELGKGWKN